MNVAIIVFPGSNCDRDAKIAVERTMGITADMIWHKDGILPQDSDLVILPGGFSYGDYLRCGAMAANSPVIEQLIKHAARGGYILGVCNGFQILCETGLLPGALMRNEGLNFVCRPQRLKIESANSAFTKAYQTGSEISVPIAHHDGNYVADQQTLDMLEGDGRIAFRYVDNPNGSMHDIAGILSANGRVLGMMPHPERAIGMHEGGDDGVGVFESLHAAV